jgi:hypothetical protein
MNRMKWIGFCLAVVILIGCNDGKASQEGYANRTVIEGSLGVPVNVKDGNSFDPIVSNANDTSLSVTAISLLLGSNGVNGVEKDLKLPLLNFSDLISGPDSGLNDGLGSGVIVTIWGQNLGSSQSDSTISFTDAGSNIAKPAHVYYWKNADGSLPGGPANLYASHGMQEIAFSIPDATPGEGAIQVTVKGATSNKLPFTIRQGNIYHVKSSGNDSTGNGTFDKPWSTVGNALIEIDEPGSTIYVHDSLVSDSNPHKAIYWNNSGASSGLSNQFSIIAYPGSRPKAVGYSGFRNYNTAGQVVSKYDIYASDCDEDNQGQPTNCATTPSLNQSYGIQSSAYGRAVGNAITDRPGGCADGSQGAISGNALSGRDRVSGYQILGNEIYEYGCTGSNKLHHTTYLSVRSAADNLQVDPWRFGWNYLHDNKTKNGIHQYDENYSGTLCGSPNDTVVINDNVIINQSGAGINIGANCPWTNDFQIYGNVLINVGLALDWDGMDPNTSNGPNTSGISIQDGGLMGTVKIYNNTIHTWNDDDLEKDTQACLGVQGTGNNVTIVWNDNVCYTDKDKPFVAAGCCGAEVQLDNITGANNAWYYSGSLPLSAFPPDWDLLAKDQDPRLTVVGARVEVESGSPLIGTCTSNLLSHDVYGVVRSAQSDIGAVQFVESP